MGLGPQEAHQDGDELRADVETLIKGPGDQNSGTTDSSGGYRPCALRCPSNTCQEPRNLTAGKQWLFSAPSGAQKAIHLGSGSS
jgi:hypothetical protein